MNSTRIILWKSNIMELLFIYINMLTLFYLNTKLHCVISKETLVQTYVRPRQKMSGISQSKCCKQKYKHIAAGPPGPVFWWAGEGGWCLLGPCKLNGSLRTAQWARGITSSYQEWCCRDTNPTPAAVALILTLVRVTGLWGTALPSILIWNRPRNMPKENFTTWHPGLTCPYLAMQG